MFVYAKLGSNLDKTGRVRLFWFMMNAINSIEIYDVHLTHPNGVRWMKSVYL